MNDDSDLEPELWDPLLQRYLKALPPAVSLSPQELARIGRRLAEADGSRVHHRRWATALAIVAVAGLALVLLARPHRARLDAGALIVPASTVAHLEGQGHAQLVALGPMTLLHPDSPSLRHGRLIVSTEESPVEVTVPDGHVRVQPHSRVVIEVSTQTRVAAYAGSASVELREFRRELTLAAGAQLGSEGIGPAPVEERREVVTLLAPATKPERTPETIAPDRAPADESSATPELHPRRELPLPETRAPRSHGADAEPANSNAPLEPSESELIAAAIEALNHDRPELALQTVERDWERHPHGQLAREADTTGIEALLRLHRQADALARLDTLPLDADDGQLSLIRGELRSAAGRCAEALTDFTRVLPSANSGWSGRARYERGICRARLGDRDGATQDFAVYLRAAPHGELAGEARRALGLP